MRFLDRPRARAALLLFVLFIPTAWLFRAQLLIPVDIENHSLKGVDTPEARTLERRVRSFGSGEVVLAAFDGAWSDSARRGVDQLAQRIGAFEGVAGVHEWPRAKGSARVVAFELDVPSGDFAPVLERIETELAAHTPTELHSALSGEPLAEVVIAREVQAEQRRVVPLLVAALIALLFAYYRHLGLVAAILLPAAIGIVWTSGAFALLGRKLDPVSVMLQPVLLTVGVASGVHWIEAYLEHLSHGLAAPAAARRAIDELRMPAMMAASTTVIGFLSLAFNAIPAVIDFGVFAALGIAVTYWLASLATPAFLVLLAPRVGAKLLARRGRTVNLLGKRAADWLAARATRIRIGAVLVALAGVAAWTRLGVDNDPQRVLPEHHPFRRDSREVARAVGGSDAFDVLVPAESSAADPVQLGLFAAAVLDEPGVAGPAGGLQRSADGDWLLRFLLAPSGSSAREKLFDAVEARARALGVPEIRVTGTSVQIARDSGRLIRSTLWGTGTSMLCLFLVFWIGFRSAYYAWLALVPNVLPCIVIYGGLGLIGRPLSFATAMISSVMLGLIVDDTIHLLHHYRELRASGRSSLAAIEEVYQRSGRATSITSVVLGLGFAIGLLGELSTTIEFCTVATITIAVAFVSDLVLLPAILVERGREPVPEAEAVRA